MGGGGERGEAGRGNSFLKANSIDPVQMPRSIASELNLHCLYNTSKRVAGLCFCCAVVLRPR